MGSIPAYPTFTPLEVPSAAKMNQIKSAGDFWALTPRCAVSSSAAQSVATGTTYILFTNWDTETFDIVQSGDTPMHDLVTNPERVFVRTTGKYQVSGQVTFAANATGFRGLNLRSNSAGNPASGTSLLIATSPAINGAETSVPIPPFVVPLTAGDYLEVFVRQNSGGALNTQTNRSFTALTVKLDSA